MERGRNHIGEDDLESYAMNRLGEARLEEVEEHLLICQECRDRLEETESFIRAIRSASVRALRREIPFRRGLSWRSAPVVLATSAVLVIAVLVARAPGGGPGPVAVNLEAVRGPVAGHAPAPAGKPLVLHMDLADAPTFPAYSATVVDERGRRLWQGAGEARNGRLTIRVPNRLSPGRYYVRVYSPHAELLLEYGFQTAPR